MPELQAPSLRVARSVRAIAQAYGDDVWPRYVSEIAAAGDDQLRRWVDQLHAESAGAVLDSTGERVPRTHYWWVEDAEYLGRLTLYHHLTPALERCCRPPFRMPPRWASTACWSCATRTTTRPVASSSARADDPRNPTPEA